MPKKSIAILSPRFPYPLEKGDKLRLWNYLVRLSKYYKIVLIALSEYDVNEKDRSMVKAYCDSLHIIKLPSQPYIRAAAKSFFKNIPIQVAFYSSRKIQKKIDKIIEDTKPDLIFIQLIRMAYYAENFQGPVLIDYMDAMSLNMKRTSGLSRGVKKIIYRREYQLLQKYETQVARRIADKTVISFPDKHYLEALTDEKFKVLTNGVDTSFFIPKPDSKKEFDIVFVGNMGYEPNVNAAITLHEIAFEKPWKILIAGARPDKKLLQLRTDRFEVCGWMEDIRTAYYSGKIMVAPIFTGAGQQNKILESLALGIPCITTLQVASGIGLENNRNVLIANSKEEFISQIELLLCNKTLHSELSINGRVYVEEYYSWDNEVNKMQVIIKDLINGNKIRRDN